MEVSDMINTLNINELEGYYKTMELAESQLRGKEIDEYIYNLSKWLEKRFS